MGSGVRGPAGGAALLVIFAGTAQVGEEPELYRLIPEPQEVVVEVGEAVPLQVRSYGMDGNPVEPDYAFVRVEGVGQEPGNVDVFDLRTFERVADVAVGRQASGIAFWRMEER